MVVGRLSDGRWTAVQFQISIGQDWGTAVPLRPSEPSRPSPGQLRYEICVRAIDPPIDRSIDDRRIDLLVFFATDGRMCRLGPGACEYTRTPHIRNGKVGRESEAFLILTVKIRNSRKIRV